jgi:hypothetical protein
MNFLLTHESSPFSERRCCNTGRKQCFQHIVDNFTNVLLQVSSVLNGQEEFGEFLSVRHERKQKCQVKLFVANNGKQDVSNIHLSIEPAWPVAVEDDSHVISCLRAGGGTPYILVLHFSCDAIEFPSNNQVRRSCDLAYTVCSHTVILQQMLYTEECAFQADAWETDCGISRCWWWHLLRTATVCCALARTPFAYH